MTSARIDRPRPLAQSPPEERWLEDFRDELAPLSLGSDRPSADRPGEMWFQPERPEDSGPDASRRHPALRI